MGNGDHILNAVESGHLLCVFLKAKKPHIPLFWEFVAFLAAGLPCLNF